MLFSHHVARSFSPEFIGSILLTEPGDKRAPNSHSQFPSKSEGSRRTWHQPSCPRYLRGTQKHVRMNGINVIPEKPKEDPKCSRLHLAALHEITSEQVQRTATGMLQGDTSPMGTGCELGLFSMGKRRLQGDLSGPLAPKGAVSRKGTGSVAGSAVTGRGEMVSY